MEELLEILNELHPEVDFENANDLIDSHIIDSFDIVAIISEVGDRFDVTISAEYITPENFNSAENLWNLIERLEEEG